MGSNVINVYHQPLSEVPDSIYRQLVRLNKRENGIMRGVITRQRRFPSEYKDTTVFYVKGRANTVKGWSLVYRDYGKHECHFYVKQKERNKGYGSALAQVVKETYKRKKLIGYTDCSTIFRRNRINHVW